MCCLRVCENVAPNCGVNTAELARTLADLGHKPGPSTQVRTPTPTPTTPPPTHTHTHTHTQTHTYTHTKTHTHTHTHTPTHTNKHTHTASMCPPYVCVGLYWHDLLQAEQPKHGQSPTLP